MVISSYNPQFGEYGNSMLDEIQCDLRSVDSKFTLSQNERLFTVLNSSDLELTRFKKIVERESLYWQVKAERSSGGDKQFSLIPKCETRDGNSNTIKNKNFIKI